MRDGRYAGGFQLHTVHLHALNFAVIHGNIGRCAGFFLLAEREADGIQLRPLVVHGERGERVENGIVRHGVLRLNRRANQHAAVRLRFAVERAAGGFALHVKARPVVDDGFAVHAALDRPRLSAVRVDGLFDVVNVLRHGVQRVVEQRVVLGIQRGQADERRDLALVAHGFLHRQPHQIVGRRAKAGFDQRFRALERGYVRSVEDAEAACCQRRAGECQRQDNRRCEKGRKLVSFLHIHFLQLLERFREGSMECLIRLTEGALPVTLFHKITPCRRPSETL